MILGPNFEIASLRVDSEGRLLVSGGPTDFSRLNYVESGLLPPASGTLAAATVSAGVAHVEGNRVALAATAPGLTASSDNYLDISRTGLIVTAVGIGAAAPAIPVNAMRLGYTRTDATSAVSRVIGAFDSLGNWMHNTTAQPMCRLRSNTVQGFGGAEIQINFPDADVLDNAGLHNPGVNPSRITFPYSGAYHIDVSVQYTENETALSTMALYGKIDGAEDPAFPQTNSVGTHLNLHTSGTVHVRAGQYFEIALLPNGVSGAVAAAWLTCVKVG